MRSKCSTTTRRPCETARVMASTISYCCLKADSKRTFDVEGVRGEVVFRREGVERRRLEVHAVVVIGQLQPRKEPLDERRLARCLGADDAHDQVAGIEVALGQLRGHEVEPLPAPRRRVDRVDQHLVLMRAPWKVVWKRILSAGTSAMAVGPCYKRPSPSGRGLG